MKHELKIKHEFYNAVLNGDKNFEVRNDDRHFQKGDIVKFTVIHSTGSGFDFEASETLPEFEITYVLHGWGIPANMCVFGMKPVEVKP